MLGVVGIVVGSSEPFDPHQQFCPNCGIEWWAGEVLGGERHYSDIIGVIRNDMVQEWRCPGCSATWPRDLSKALAAKNGYRSQLYSVEEALDAEGQRCAELEKRLEAAEKVCEAANRWAYSSSTRADGTTTALLNSLVPWRALSESLSEKEGK